MSFYLVKLERDGNNVLIETTLSGYGPYEKGAEAAAEAKTLANILGVKVMPRRISQANVDWRARQVERIANGTLKALPEGWNLAPIADHFAHHYELDHALIAFTENEELAIIDRVTALTAGRYITRFYPHVDDAERRRLIALIDPSNYIFYATTPEDITMVYKEGPSSCMDARHSFNHLPVWPTSVYGAGDLAVAYTRNARGAIQSRSLCWPEKKLFGRCYGDEARMRKAMESEGFEYLDYDEDENFEGARLLKIQRTDDKGYVLPYFDNIALAIDKGDHFICSNKHNPGDVVLHSGGTGGYAYPQKHCPKRGTLEHLDSFKFVHGANEEWSRDARTRFSFTCDGTGEIWAIEYRVRLGNGLVWCQKHADEHAGKCELTGKFYPKDELIEHEGKTIHESMLPSNMSLKPSDVINSITITVDQDNNRWFSASVDQLTSVQEMLGRQMDREYRRQFLGSWPAVAPDEMPRWRAINTMDGRTVFAQDSGDQVNPIRNGSISGHGIEMVIIDDPINNAA
jgi:hypothetical protein